MLRAFILFTFVTALLLGVSAPTRSASTSFDGPGPSVISTNKLVVIPGDNVTFTATLTGVATGNEAFTVSAPVGTFTNLPSTITPAAGATSVTFTGTVGVSLTGGMVVTVSDGVVTVPSPTLIWLWNNF